MSLYDNASLVMIPSGVKEDKLYSVKPTDGSGDFTFSRGSDIQATRVNSSGLIEKAKVNLLTYSNDFSNAAWIKLGNGTGTAASVTSGFSDPDGGSNAWRLQCDLNGGTSSSDQSLIYQLGSATGVFAFSYYVKSNTGASQDFAFGNGLAGGNFTTATATTSWQRFDVFFNCTANNTSFIGARGTMGTDDTLDILIYAAQLNHGLIAQDYVETTTTSVVEGLTADLPRLDYSGGASCPSLLLEPSRTNVITSSEHLGSYSVSNVSVSYNNATSPEGVQNATLVTGDSGTLIKVVNFNPASNGAYTISVFAKYNTHQWIQLGMGGVATYANFDIQNGVVGGTNGTSDIEDYGNGWYRCSVQTTTGTPLSHYIGMVDSSSAARLATSTSTNSFWAYGMQSEIGSYKTSYIPTYGTAANRGVDDVNEKTGLTSIIGQTEGTLFLDFVPNSKDFQIYYQIRTTGGSNVGQIDIRYQSSNLRTLGSDGGSTQFTISYGDIVVGQRYKCAVRYKNNDCAFYVNGTLAGADTNASFSSSSLDQVGFNENTGNFFPSADIKQALVFPTALTNAELAALTTI